MSACRMFSKEIDHEILKHVQLKRDMASLRDNLQSEHSCYVSGELFLTKEDF